MCGSMSILEADLTKEAVARAVAAKNVPFTRKGVGADGFQGVDVHESWIRGHGKASMCPGTQPLARPDMPMHALYINRLAEQQYGRALTSR